MNYIEREAERKFLKMNGFFKAVLVTGARQVGKTTMLRHLSDGTDRKYVSMDDSRIRALAQSDPVLFFQTYKPPILIDEVQKMLPRRVNIRDIFFVCGIIQRTENLGGHHFREAENGVKRRSQLMGHGGKKP